MSSTDYRLEPWNHLGWLFLSLVVFNFLLTYVEYSYFKLQLVCSNLFSVSRLVTHVRCSIRVKMKNTALIPEATCIIRHYNYSVLKYNWHLCAV